MASRVKPPGKGKPKPPKAAKPSKGGKGAKGLGDNADRIRSHFKTFQVLHDELGSVSGEVRKRIADAYSTAASDLGVPKKVVKHLWALEKFRLANEEKEHDFDSRDRDALQALGEALGADTPLGKFALEASGRAKADDFGGGQTERSDDVEDDGEESQD